MALLKATIVTMRLASPWRGIWCSTFVRLWSLRVAAAAGDARLPVSGDPVAGRVPGEAGGRSAQRLGPLGQIGGRHFKAGRVRLGRLVPGRPVVGAQLIPA